jgi:hypothetical protein
MESAFGNDVAQPVEFGDEAAPQLVPSVFRRNLQCNTVRAADSREECHWSHVCSLQANMSGIQWHPLV